MKSARPATLHTPYPKAGHNSSCCPITNDRIGFGRFGPRLGSVEHSPLNGPEVGTETYACNSNLKEIINEQ